MATNREIDVISVSILSAIPMHKSSDLSASDNDPTLASKKGHTSEAAEVSQEEESLDGDLLDGDLYPPMLTQLPERDPAEVDEEQYQRMLGGVNYYRDELSPISQARDDALNKIWGDVFDAAEQRWADLPPEPDPMTLDDYRTMDSEDEAIQIARHAPSPAPSASTRAHAGRTTAERAADRAQIYAKVDAVMERYPLKKHRCQNRTEDTASATAGQSTAAEQFLAEEQLAISTEQPQNHPTIHKDEAGDEGSVERAQVTVSASERIGKERRTITPDSSLNHGGGEQPQSVPPPSKRLKVVIPQPSLASGITAEAVRRREKRKHNPIPSFSISGHEARVTRSRVTRMTRFYEEGLKRETRLIV